MKKILFGGPMIAAIFVVPNQKPAKPQSLGLQIKQA
jgi:hypothetical protein